MLSKGLVLCSKTAFKDLKEFFKYWKCRIETKEFSEGKKPTHTLITYSTSHLAKKDLVRFFYALKGRNGRSGIIASTDSEFLAKGVILSSKSDSSDVIDFLRYWKCKFTAREVVIKK